MTSHESRGSAEQYIPHDPMARYLYAVRVVRKARTRSGIRTASSYRSREWQAPFYPDAIPLDKPALIGYRAYLNPVTGSGAAYEDLIPDRAIWFKLQ